ncbi:DUF3961 domain-containing protein [Bacillus sp. 165]|uniref:DUF3961 domain-containing protein n=1 Tax=Bacillus sp. 165 TaxID=1529117 RepID=UPI001ADAABE7|nr:DUF3961 domain-containing protein [Bacillus sp. 165]MBO9128266.1 DUF3961 domain-containing protein [Bacillus sp. 165]
MIQNSLIVPRTIQKEAKKGVSLREKIARVNMFFGLENRSDCIWFYGVYGLSLSILVFTFVLSNILDTFHG